MRVAARTSDATTTLNLSRRQSERMCGMPGRYHGLIPHAHGSLIEPEDQVDVEGIK